jgi:methyl-accepting chemotaxis protein
LLTCLAVFRLKPANKKFEKIAIFIFEIFTQDAVIKKHQVSIRRRFFFFSTVLFLLIFVFGSFAFIIFMRRIRYDNTGYELIQTVEMKKLKLEASMSKEIAGYRRAFTGKNVFWINDIDKNYYFGDEYVYTLDPAEGSSQWYNSIMKNTDIYNLMVNFDIGIKSIMLWIDAPV